VIAVADSIDAMMSNRSYRHGMSPEKCRREIEKNAGMMYDPQIAVTVLENWNLVLESRSVSLPEAGFPPER
jgi:HD-GYP domain-containing protein (c-di-GMP phosphodiesterase class II)